MILSWLPEEYDAAVAITDDPDNSSLSTFKIMYDYLVDINFPTTRAMWVHNSTEPTGTPFLEVKFTAPLLDEMPCFEYCKELMNKGFEICLHGASSGNNHRMQTISALDLMTREFSSSPVFICHSKNAENLYWDVKTANSRLEKYLLNLYTKNSCFGDVADSDYFWGDICRERIRFIRMFRTRMVNTLAFNPSMPYHDFTKPYVNFWFSATKGYIPALFSDDNIDKLCSENGASILYQYLHKYVKDNVIIPEVKDTLKKLADDKRIWKRPVSVILERLKQMQNILVINLGGWTYIINASSEKIDSIQFKINTTEHFYSFEKYRFSKNQKKVIFDSIESYSCCKFKSSEHIDSTCKQYALDGNIVTINLPKATVYCNICDNPVSLQIKNKQKFLAKKSIFVDYKTPEAKRLEILNEIQPQEILKLKFGQMQILLREHILLGRKFSTKAYLKTPGRIEDMSNW